MKTLIGNVLTVLLLAAVSYAQDNRQLFNGKDLDGWQHVGPGRFIVENGLLKTEGGMGLLWYTGQKFGNTRIRILYKPSHVKANSGIFIRIPEKPTEEWMPVNRGYEVQIDDGEDEFHRTGVLYSLTKAIAKPEATGEWNTMEITLSGPHTVVEVNGVKVTDFSEGQPVPPKKKSYEPDRGPRPLEGYIGLQNHSKGDVVYFKEISVVSLTSK